ncbi:MAG: glycosyltransferase family 2 protein [Oscillospiraceae bacterium]|nr:glycosyltransferase family 2 protein [Oscillospiraceae bacterium]
MKVSLVVPCYNEEENIALFAETAEQAMAGMDYEIIFINDGSRDNTLGELKKLVDAKRADITVVDFSRNFGKEAGMYAGLQKASGDYISFVDADLQQPVSVAREMVEFLEENPDYDAVACYQDTRIEGKGLSFLKRGFYRVINMMCDIQFREDASDFRTIRRKVADAILSMPEYHRFSKGIFAWVGYNTYYRPYEVQERHAGTTSWSTLKLFKYAIDGMISFSTKPLKIATGMGLFTSFCAILYMIVVILQKLIFGIDVPGYPTLVSLILLLGGVQLTVLGIIGEYLARVHMEVKHRPIFLERGCYKCKKED